MSKREKLVAQMKANPKRVRFDDINALLQYHGYSRQDRGTSHVRYQKPGSVIIIVRPHAGRNYLDVHDVRSALEALGV